MSNQQNPKPVLALAVALVIAGAGAGFFLMVGSAPQEPVVMVEGQPAAVPPDPRLAPAPMPAPVDDPPVVEERPTASTKPTKANRLARDLQREQIWTALGREHNLKPAAPGSAAPSPSAASLLPSLDPKYIRETIKDQLVPVMVDCYNTVLTTEDDQAGGKLIMNFTIVGVEEVGGVVEEAEIDEASTLQNEFMRECLRESLMAVTFEPPPDGGRVQVSYPLTFSPD